jgi:Zn-dependent metalloprotease
MFRVTKVATGVIALALTAGSTSLASPVSAATPADKQTDEFGHVRVFTPHQAVAATANARGLNAAAQSYLPLLAKEFKVDAGNLAVKTYTDTSAGGVIRTKQTINGVDVFGAEIVQVLDKSGKLVTAHGKTSQRSVGQFPADLAAAATSVSNTAVSAVLTEDSSLNRADLHVTDSSPIWYDPTLVGDPGAAAAVPALTFSVSGKELEDHWTVLVPLNGAKAISWSQTHEAVNRVVCDAKQKAIDVNTASNYACGTTIATSRTESSGTASNADVNSVFNFFGDTQSFYSGKVGIDLTNLIGANYNDGNGKALRGTVRICTTSDCPYANAFWDGAQMAFGEGVSTDDVTGHELTHGVSEKVASLSYYRESGAVNESFSDIFGEFVDLSNGSADDTAANRWKIGEGSSLGVIRDMKTPTAYSDPDSKGSSYWYTGSSNSSYVHINSGVGNKTAYLIADGGTFNSQTVTGIGIDKSAALWYATLQRLPSSSTYPDVATALKAACTANASAGVAGTTTADCTNVGKAITATQLTSTRA